MLHGKGDFIIRFSGTTDPLLRKVFWCSGFSNVLVVLFPGREILWFQVLILFEVKIFFFTQVLVAWLVVLSCCFWKTKTKPTQCLVMHTIGLCWAGPETIHSFCILYSKPSSDKWFANILSHSVCYLFTFIIVSLKHSSCFLFWLKFSSKEFLFFLWWVVLLVFYIRNHCLNQGHRDLHVHILLTVL